MRASAAYFVGAGTMVAALAIGLGGGLIAGNIMNPISPKQGPDTSKLERRAEPVVATRPASEPVQYVAASQAFGATLAPPARVETQAATANAEAQPAQTTAASETQPAGTAAAAPQARPAEQQALSQPASAPDNAYAKARDSDLKRAAVERRRAERRQQWAERRRHEMREPRDRTDWDDVARNVREDSESHQFATGPRFGAPQIRLFGDDDD